MHVGVDLEVLGGVHSGDGDRVVGGGSDARHETDDDGGVLGEGPRDVAGDIERLRVPHGQLGRVGKVEGEDAGVGFLIEDRDAGVGFRPVAFSRERAVVELIELHAVAHVDREANLLENPVLVEGGVFRRHAQREAEQVSAVAEGEDFRAGDLADVDRAQVGLGLLEADLLRGAVEVPVVPHVVLLGR